MCHLKLNKNCDFVDLFEFSSTFLNLIQFWLRRFSLNFRNLLNISIFIFCLVNWTDVSLKIEQKVWFCRSFWIFLYVLELNSVLTTQNFTILQKNVHSINIYIFTCNLNLWATWNWTKSMIMSDFSNFPSRFGT